MAQIKITLEEVKRFRDYVLEKGFEHQEIWYFRKTWMNKRDFYLFEQSGLIKKVGTPNHLKDKNIFVPLLKRDLYTGRGQARTKIYKITDFVLNRLISERQNGKTAKS